MTAPNVEAVQNYYDARVAGKLGDFTHVNPRIEAAIDLLAEWAPQRPRRILEIGCSVGATSWRMARAWPDAEVIGVDISPGSIEVAQGCFRLPNLSYRAGLVTPDFLTGEFDLVLMMDVYEHIPASDRPTVHAAIKAHLADECRVVITVPTPALQHAAIDIPGGLQPVDEDIGLDEIKTLATDTATQLLYMRQIGIWEYGDYAHLVFGRFEELAKVAVREQRPEGGGMRTRLKAWLRGAESVASSGRRGYLGHDVGCPPSGNPADKLRVSVEERRRVVSAWQSKS